jgi:uncharacterized repeat protein (TIGR03803 family)
MTTTNVARQNHAHNLHLLATIIALFLCASAALASAQTEGILHSFAGGTTDGATPYAGLIADSTGAFYGTAAYEGPNGQGIVYQLTHPLGGAWTENIIYSFFGTTDGSVPASNLIMDSTGAIYGTTAGAGTFNCGTFYQLVPPSGGGTWTENTLYSFPCASGGVESGPQSLVLNQSTGVFYGVLQGGGIYNGGVVFELAPASGGGWTYTALHNFNSNPSAPGYANGCNPWSLIAGPNGGLYGTTQYCGASGSGGTAFRLTPPSGSGTNWNFTLLYTFGSSTSLNGNGPLGLVIGAGGVLYGTTASGGTSSNGTVYSLAPSGSGTPWTQTIIHNFAGAPSDGIIPLSGVVVGPSGVLYGTTAGGGLSNASCGSYPGCGTVFQLTPGTGGTWTETILHNFTSTGGDAVNPNPGPLLVHGGNLYGTTYNGGGRNNGAVYVIHP